MVLPPDNFPTWEEKLPFWHEINAKPPTGACLMVYDPSSEFKYIYALSSNLDAMKKDFPSLTHWFVVQLPPA